VPEADTLDQICQIDHARGLGKEALDVCKRAVDLWLSLGKPWEATDSLNNLGLMHRDLGETAAARKCFQEALAIFDKYPKPGKRATVLNNMALLAEYDGEYGQALTLYHQAFAGFEAAHRGAHSGVALYNIGRMQARLGDDDAALSYYLQSNRRLEKAGDVLWRIQSLQGLAELYVKRGDFDSARKVLEHALDLSRNAHAKPQTAGSLEQMGALHLALHRPDEALAPLEEALSLYRETGNRWAEAVVHSQLAKADQQLGRDSEALDDLHKAMSLNDELGNRSALASNRYEAARIERSRRQLDKARESIEGAIGLVDSMRPEVGGEELRALFAATKQPYYDFYIDLLMTEDARDPKAGHAAEALLESEHARARSLLETLAEAHLNLDADAPPELRARKAEIERQLDAKELQRQRLIDDRPSLEEQVSRPQVGRTVSADARFQVELDLEHLLTKLRGVEQKIREASPRYAALTRPAPVSVEEIQHSLLDDRTTLLELSLGETRSFLWAVTSDRFDTFELPAEKTLETEARCLHWLLTAYNDPPAADELSDEQQQCLGELAGAYRQAPGGGYFAGVARRRGRIRDAYRATARHLSGQLLGGASEAGLLRPRLAVVSDGALQYVPFAALPDPAVPGGSRPLVVAHELVRLPSASVLAFQRSRRPSETGDRGEVAIIADPVYRVDDPRLAGASESGGSSGDGEALRGRATLQTPPLPDFRRLPFAGEEARAIEGFADPAASFEAEGVAASRDTVLSGRLEGYRYVHFAAHGVIDTSHPQLSGLVLSLVDGAGNPRPDGFLRLHDIYGLRLDADLVVLSACDTALGREVRGEGLVGLTRGFMYAGAERVVASLWEVQDRATARLMTDFYRGLIEEGRRPADALRRAQIQIMEDPGQSLEFPYYWAGFVLQGDWR
jgi:CHAT domain-containing protein/tetratricopeptide (TPR) repeat protein